MSSQVVTAPFRSAAALYDENLKNPKKYVNTMRTLLFRLQGAQHAEAEAERSAEEVHQDFYRSRCWHPTGVFFGGLMKLFYKANSFAHQRAVQAWCT